MTLTDEQLLKAIAELKSRKVKIGVKPNTMALSPAAKEVADAFGVSVVQLHSDVIRHRQQKYRDYMRNYMRKRRNSKPKEEKR